jgi:hypothetical protein
MTISVSFDIRVLQLNIPRLEEKELVYKIVF